MTRTTVACASVVRVLVPVPAAITTIATVPRRRDCTWGLAIHASRSCRPRCRESPNEQRKPLEQAVTVPSQQADGSASIGVNERDGGTPYDARLLFDADGTSMQRRTQDLAHASRADDLGARETARACAPSFTRRWFRAHRRGSPSRPSFPAACAGVCLLRRLRNGTAGSRPASTEGHRVATSARSRAVASGRSAPDGRCRASPSSDEVVVTTDLDFTLIESEATEGLPRPLTAGRNCPAS